MQIDQLAFVLDYVDTSIHDTELLPAYQGLLDAVSDVKREQTAAGIELVHERREALFSLLEAIHPHAWSSEQMDILESYDAVPLLGIPAIVRIQAAFIENFMNPKALVADLDALHHETLALAERVTLLLKGLDPVLTDLPEQTVAFVDGEPVDGEVVDGNLRSMPDGQVRNPLAVIRSRLNNQKESTAVVRADDSIPLATKLIAAAPVVLAAAGKALEVYRTYNDAKQSLAKTKPQQQAPKTSYPSSVATGQPGLKYVRYSYHRSVYITTRDETSS